MPFPTLRDAVEQAELLFDAAESKLADLIVQLADATAQLALRTQERDTARAETSSHRVEIATLKTTVTSLQGRIKELETQIPGPAQRAPWPWGPGNSPADFKSVEEVRAFMPKTTAVTEVPLPSGSNLFQRVAAAAKTAGKPTIASVAPGQQIDVNQMVKIGSGTTPRDMTQVSGFWDQNFRGFSVAGSGDKHAVITMKPGAMPQSAVDALGTIPIWGWMGASFGRIDSKEATPHFVGGIDFRGSDQGPLTKSVYNDDPAVASKIKLPQPAPMNGVIFYNLCAGVVAYSKFSCPGRISTSQPPFETGAFGSQRGKTFWTHVEFSGKRHPSVDPAEPKRGGAFMLNNELDFTMEYFWLHDVAASRIAYNGQNDKTKAKLAFRYGKIEHISDSGNNEGFGGGTPATCMGFEDSMDQIEVTDVDFYVDSTVTSRTPSHVQFTTVKPDTGNPSGGHIVVKGSYFFHRGFPQLNGFPIYRIDPRTKWFVDGLQNTIEHYHPHDDTKRLTPVEVPVSVAWPPTKAWLDANADVDKNYLWRRA